MKLQVRVRTHYRWQEVPCVVCGSLHLQQYVAAVLYDNGKPRGDLCPQCLNREPRAAVELAGEFQAQRQAHADQASKRAARLREQARQIQATPVPVSARRPRQGDARRRAHQAERLRAEARRLSEQAVGLREQPAGPTTAEVRALARRVAALPAWGVSVADLVQAERAALWDRLPRLTERQLRLLVDERYQELLGEGGWVPPPF
jgi:hypothetical protein